MKTFTFVAYLAFAGTVAQANSSLSTAAKPTCPFGETWPELNQKFDTFDADSYTIKATNLEGITQQQILIATRKKTLKAAFASAGRGVIYTLGFSSPTLPADSYTVIYFDQGDALNGAIFETDETTPQAWLNDGEIVNCK